MKKIIISFIATILLSMPCINIFAGSGDAAAGVAAGLIGGALLTGVTSGSNNRSRRAEEEARRAQEQTRELRREQQKEKVTILQRQMERQQSGKTINMLIFAIVLLFLGLAGLGIIILKRK